MNGKGKLYGVGVGPGDPELLTLKAARLLRECDVVAAPDGERTAYQIAQRFAQGKPTLFCSLPMTRDRAAMAASHEAAADALCALLDEGKTVVFLTLGDPSVYSTYWYIHRLAAARGYAAEMVPGVPSFCAAAAALGRALCEGSEALHILPASHGQALPEGGNLVLMKAANPFWIPAGSWNARGVCRTRRWLSAAAWRANASSPTFPHSTKPPVIFQSFW